jgi:hypothetical protein
MTGLPAGDGTNDPLPPVERTPWRDLVPEPAEPEPVPGSRAAGCDPHDVMGHPVDYEGQDCPRCRDDFNRGLR